MSYSKLYNYDDFLSFLNQGGFETSAKKQKEAFDANLEEEIKKLENKKTKINSSSDELARQAYIAYLSTSKDLPEKLTATGLNGGAADNLYLSLVNEYQNNYNDIEKDRRNKINDTDNEITAARLSNSSDYKEALSNLYENAVDSFLDMREGEEERNFDSYYNDRDLEMRESERKSDYAISQSELELKKKIAEQERVLEVAKLAAATGDIKLLKKLGINPSSGYTGTQNSASGSSSSSSSSSGSKNNIADLIKQLNYATELAKYGNYTLLCQITGMTAEEAALKFANEGAPYSEKQIREAAKLFMGGDYSKNVLKILKSAYPEYSYKQIWGIWESIALTEWYMDISDGYTGPQG